jgi:hypothetical protein
MKVLLWILQFAFCCHHRQLSRVLTIEKRTYQVCLECGQEFGYSWKLMHSVGSSVDDKGYTSPDSAIHAEVPLI